MWNRVNEHLCAFDYVFSICGGNMTNDSQYVAKDVSSLLDYTIINKADIDHVSDTIEFLAIR